MYVCVYLCMFVCVYVKTYTFYPRQRGSAVRRSSIFSRFVCPHNTCCHVREGPPVCFPAIIYGVTLSHRLQCPFWFHPLWRNHPLFAFSLFPGRVPVIYPSVRPFKNTPFLPPIRITRVISYNNIIVTTASLHTPFVS